MGSMKNAISTSLIADMDSLIQRMLKLAEEDAETFAEKAEMYYRRRPELIGLVKDFYRMYRTLAERSDLDCRRSVQCDFQSQCSGISDIGSPPSTLPSPDRQTASQKSLELPVVEFDESESESIHNNSDKANGEVKSNEDNKTSETKELMENYEEEPEESIIDGVAAVETEVVEAYAIHDIDECLVATAEKLQLLEVELMNKESVVKDLQDELGSIHIWQICKSLEDEKKKAQMKHLKYEITSKNRVVEDLKKNLQILHLQHGTLEADLRTKNAALLEELISRDEEIEMLNIHLEQLRKEKDDLITLKEDEIDGLNNEVHRLRVEQVAADSAARRATDELRWKMREVEWEVEKRDEIIMEGVAEKEEAIRQLCSSVRHYGNAYHMLRSLVN